MYNSLYSNTMNKVIVIVGTNASGKSSLAVRLAKKYNGEVISADSRQVYKGLDIATGKITKKEMDGVAHHLLDVADPCKRYSASDFARDGKEAMREIYHNGKIPIVAGGTGFYIQALLEPDTLPHIPPNLPLRRELENLSPEALLERLYEIDSSRAQDIENKNEEKNKRRLIRAIEIASYREESSHNTTEYDEYSPFSDMEVLWIGLEWDKEKLEERIRERTIQRMEEGMVEEAQRLYDSGLSYERMRELGLEYTHLADYLENKITKEELVERIIIADRQYAKRQRTWFKRNKDIHWFTQENIAEVDVLVSNFLSEN